MSEDNSPLNLPGRKFYYPSLDGLRFFAFLLVFLHHTLINVSSDNLLLNSFLVIIQKNGWVGVDLFFVLSGYLITTLLLRERQEYGKFSLKNFYIRRSLRIWPLYYLAIIVGFFVVPNIFPANNAQDLDSVLKELPLYLVFLGNWQVSINGYSHFSQISHLWTISLEEQFYLFWPLILLKLTSYKKVLFYGFSLIALAVTTRLILAILQVEHPGIYTNTLARLDTLTLGALLSVIVFYKPKLINKVRFFLTTPAVILTSIVFLLFLYRFYFLNPDPLLYSVFGYLIIALFMGYYLLAALINRQIQKLLSFKLFVWAGKISYGLYIWHILAIELTNKLQISYLLTHLVITFVITLFLGTISYYLYEAFFLKLKRKFTLVSSRPV